MYNIYFHWLFHSAYIVLNYLIRDNYWLYLNSVSKTYQSTVGAIMVIIVW